MAILLDGIIGGVSGLLACSGVGALASACISGALGFIGSVGGDLIVNDFDWKKVNWGKAAVMTVMNFALGWGPGIQNSKAIGTSLGTSLANKPAYKAMAKVLGNPDSKKQAVQAMFNLCGKRVAKEIAEELPKIFAKRTISTLLLTLETTVLTTLFDIGAHYLHFWND